MIHIGLTATLPHAIWLVVGMGVAVCDEALTRVRLHLSQWRVPTNLVSELIDQRSTVNFPRGAMVFLEGSPGDLFGCVLAGHVKVYCNEKNGTRVLVRLSGPGEIIGYGDYVDSKGRRSKIFEAQALTKASVALFTRERVVQLLRSVDAEPMIELLQSLNTFWSQRVHWWASFMGLSFEQRLEVVLGDLARRLGAHDTRGTLIIPELSHADLAEMIASSRPLVSRLMNDMEERGLIQRRGKQYVLLKGWDSDERGDSQFPRPVGAELR
jgi:CRP/FNR family cyclic AMP-dependent transcriptional regulator